MSIALLAIASVALAQRTEFHVAPSGNDAWSGALATPNAAGDDGPFATIHRAQTAAREADAAVTVNIAGGTYFLDEPLRLAPEDSGTTYAAYDGERPTISGGVALSDWAIDGQGRWQTRIAEVGSGKWNFSQLWVNGQRRYRPRLPKQGYYYIAGDASPTVGSQGVGHDRFRFQPGDIPADLAAIVDVEVLPFHLWGMSRMHVAEVDPERSVVTFTAPTCNTSWWAALPTGHRYILENVADALSEPGEWYLDRAAGTLTYIPLLGESPETSTVIAPRLPHLVGLAGDIETGLWVEDVHFRGITFAHTNWNAPARGHSFPQAEVNLGGAIRATGARDCSLQSCKITHVGEYAIDLAEGCKKWSVSDCAMTDMGAGGIKIGSQAYSDDEERVASDITVSDCLIAHGGRIHPAGIGVAILHSPGNVISHNDIHDFYYSGISVGWQWGYAPSHAHHNTIEDNHVHDLGHGILSDMGGIYTLGPSEGTVIRGNVFHDIESYSYGGRGIYFDQATTGILAENNLVYRARVGSYCLHFGKDNRVVNNIWALGREGMMEPVRKEDHHQFDFERNIVYWREGPFMISNSAGENYRFASNLYWNPDNPQFRIGPHTFAEWQALGQDEGTIIEDPLFVDPENGDFTLRPGSPAEKIGFVPFDYAQAGRTAAATQWDYAAVSPAFPTPPADAPSLPFFEDFELAAVGDKAPGFTTYEDADLKEATARVTDETAASGSQSLKLTDMPGQKNTWDPHVTHTRGHGEGLTRGSFDVRLEDAIVFYHEWRTPGHPYISGPSLRVRGDRMLRANDQDLALVPVGEWFHIEITCELGDRAIGEYSLTLTLPGEAPQQWDALPCSPEFTNMGWYGFCCEATDAGTMYLDNIRIERPDDEE